MPKGGLLMTKLIDELKQQNHPLIIVYFDKEGSPDLAKKNPHLAKEMTSYYYIGNDSSLLPFLSVQENLLLGISRKQKKSYFQNILKWSQYFKLATVVSNQQAASISPETKFLIHLIRGLALQREVIFLNDVELALPLDFLLDLLPSLKKITKETPTSFVIFTKQALLKQQTGVLLIEGSN